MERREDRAFFALSSESWSGLVQNKYYAFSDDLYQLIKAKDPYLLVNLFGQLTSLLETGRHNEAGELAIEALNLVMRNWPKVKTKKRSREQVIKSLHILLNSVVSSDLGLEKARLKVQLERIIVDPSYSRKFSSLPLFLMEFAILFKDESSALERLLSLEELPQKKALERCLDKKPMKSFKRPMKATSRKSASDDLLDAFDNFSKGDLEAPFEDQGPDTLNKSSKEERPPKISHEEREFLTRIRAKDPDLVDAEKIESLAHSLFGIGFYRACVALVDRSGEERRLAYLKCQALYESREYLKLLDYSTSYSEELALRTRVPFWYLGARAALKINKLKEAKTLLSQVVKIDPQFRNAKELLRSETA